MPKQYADGTAKVRVSKMGMEILSGAEDLSTWTDEELIAGRKRDRNGRWVGRPPNLVPRPVHEELTRRRFIAAFNLMSESLADAAQVLRAIINDELAETSDRLKAIDILFDRVLGKPKEQVSLDISADAGPRWKQMAARAIVGTVEDLAALDAGEIQDGEVIEADWELDDTPPAELRKRS